MSLLDFFEFLQGHSLGALFTVISATAAAWLYAEWEDF